MLFSVMSNLLAFSQVGAEEAFELTAETAHANGIDHDDSWVGGVTVQNGPEEEDDCVECSNCGTPWELEQIFPRTSVDWCPKCIKYDLACEEEMREREAAREAEDERRASERHLAAHAVGSSGWINSLPL
jgi:hypothetical protein